MSRKPRHLSKEESALWDEVRRTTRPIKPAKAKVVGTPTKSPDHLPKEPIQPFNITGSKRPASVETHTAPTLQEMLGTTPKMDTRKHRNLKRGKLRPDAKIDLHGMTQAQAHPALVGFIQRSFADGKRLVLVITGKGKDRDDGGPIPVRHGVLRHQVPHWLTAANLRPMVIQVMQAHPRHGGSGAYYVYLRRG